MTAKLSLILGMCLLFASPGWSGDWPQFLGPTRNGVYAGSDLAETWPQEGPPVLWQKKIGHGFSGPAVADHKLILFHRLENEEVVECLEATTGKPLWRFAYPTAYEDDFGFDPGPRATPSIDGGRVYTFGAEGMLHCLDLATGKKIWSVNAKTQFEAPKGFFGIACSPLIEGDALLLNIGGGKSAGIVAFDKVTGKIRWKQDGFGAGTVTLAGNQLLILTEKGELIRAVATPEEFKPNARAQTLPFQVRAYPALADGLFYARSKDKLVCVDLSPAKKH
jgi:outer membrane protein assembly factor BamB